MSVTLGNANIGDIYYGAIKITDAYLGSTHVYQSLKPITLTLCSTEGGTLTAETITGMPGDTITLSPTYNTYWRFSGYDVYGDGSVSDNTYTFGNDDEQIVSAYFKKNAFTAVGNFTGFIYTPTAYGSKKTFNAVLTGFTGSKPSNWPANNANWNVTNASAYNISIQTKLQSRHTHQNYSIGAQVSAEILINNSKKAGVTYTAVQMRRANTWYDLQTLNVTNNTTQGQPTYSGSFYGVKESYVQYRLSTNGWTATGYAP